MRSGNLVCRIPDEEGKVTDLLGLLRKMYRFCFLVIEGRYRFYWFSNEWGEALFMASEIVLGFMGAFSLCLLSY